MSKNKPSKNYIETLRLNIEHSLDYKSVISFTSTDARVKKSETVVALARNFAKGGYKICLIDANLNNGKISNLTKSTNNKGFSDVITHKIPYENVITKDIYQENLDLILSGEKIDESFDTIDSSNLQGFLDSIKHKYDYILIDTPPNKKRADANLISTKTDGVIIITDYKYSNKKDLDNSIEKIKKVNGEVLGIIISGGVI
ncbi:MAG: CpsD/CapB family tyrosine-protein kinase [Peptoniphilaceae bacterium]|nr:CpsD/CapB family tyrosine-protein kinase [Peptoniphilaceae bacterium]MDD7383754.1 CpsD/CapB family tyrosine-protein kinase [Peptoniphilaceae bacterium]MDY3737847.1 CpsD/CapB family tyrosine-protein kinase [Peptoniphilaceae bacterium]